MKGEGQYVYWCGTLWLDSEDDIDSNGTIETLKRYAVQGRFQVERGGETGRLHYQVWLKMKKKTRLAAIMKWANPVFGPGDWSPSRSEAAERYVEKNETRVQGPWEFGFPYVYRGEDIIKEEQLYDWQKELVRLATCPWEEDKRKVHWYWDSEGNMGKSAMAKYLAWHHGAQLVGGKGADIMYELSQAKPRAIEDNPKRCIIADISRTKAEWLSGLYAALETLKNGVIMGGKYDSVTTCMLPPCIICLANFEPDRSAMSDDRWDIVCVGKAGWTGF